MPEPAMQMPPDVQTAGPQPAIFTMPERYRGGAAGTPVVVPKPDLPVKPPMPVQPPKPAPKPVPPPLHGKPHGKVAILVGIGVLLVLGIAGFFVLRTTALPPPASTPVASTPPVQPTPPPTPPAPVAGAALRPGTDSDSDGLTDVEETVLYNTDPHLPSTNGSGYLDGNDVFNLYDPKVAPPPGCRVDCPNTLRAYGVTKPFSTSFSSAAPLPYVIDYPTIWTPTAVASDPLGVSFAATTGETVTVDVAPKADPAQSLADWYAAQKLTGGRPFTTKGGLSAIASDDQLTVYVDAKADVLTLHYDAGIKGTIDYLTTFKMMQNSLKLK